jgi:NAD(P)-dependent dehydrogenase (short-subunit alcohol dehydrogenase family)
VALTSHEVRLIRDHLGVQTAIGGVALFLASDDSRYVTGMTICADGGMFPRPPLQPVTADPSLPRPERRIQWTPTK